jgi:thiol:disulfide interchange protein DsbC
MKNLGLSVIGFLWATSLVAEESIEHIKKKIQEILPELTVDSMQNSPIPGLYQIQSGANLLYVSADGHFLLQGEVLDLRKPKDQWNITEVARSQVRIKFLKNLNNKDMVVYSPSQKPKGQVTIFTDVDCGYCRKQHQDVAELTAGGIEVRYLSFPRQGLGSPTFQKAVSIWCATDRKKAFETAVAGDKIAELSCANPIEQQFNLGRQFGINGTPTLLFADGTMIPGYIKASQLIQEAIKHRHD